MRVGFTLDFRNPPTHRRPWQELWNDNLFLLTEAERLGFDSVHVQEHFFTDDGYGPSIPIFLAVLAERTSRVRIGSWIYVLPLHNPAQLAQETAVLDQLCGGRLDVGVAAGHRAVEYRSFGMSEKTRPSRMDEGLEVLLKAWTTRPFSHRGRYYTFEDLEIQPAPFQSPHPPLWVGATAKPAYERAARFGLNVYSGAVDIEGMNAYWRVLEESGHDPSTRRMAQSLSITVTREDPDEYWERNKEHIFYRWDFYRKIRAELGDPDISLATAETPNAEAYRENEIIGDPETVIERIRSLRAQVKFDDIIMFGAHAGSDLRGDGHQSLRLFAEEVLPVIKDL